jgi:ATP phosphoribosyltransferase
VEIVPLSGSIELASVIGLTDRIFDLVQTGSTLEANGLVVFDEVHDISARLVANRSSFRMKHQAIQEMQRRLAAALRK